MGADGREHSLHMENRSRLDVAGVERVESFDHAEVVLVTTQGVLRITGDSLHIRGLDLETGTCGVEGTVESLSYREGRGAGRRRSLLGRLVR
jgi:sporulation protein YabP